MEIYELAKAVQNKSDFVNFVKALLDDLKSNPNNWENNTLEKYLEGVYSWVEDMEGFYRNNKIELPQDIHWKVFTDILMAAKMYE